MTKNWFLSVTLMGVLASIGPLILRRVQNSIEKKIFKERNLYYHASIKDILTGTFNRTYFELFFYKEVKRVIKENKVMSVMFIDIDKFKDFNDSYGHQNGDVILKLVSTTLKKNTDKDDKIIRYGGDEFLIVLTNKDSSAAHGIASNIKQKIEKAKLIIPYNKKDKVVNTTVSIGIAQLKDGEKARVFFHRADKALYKAKNKGRNEVIVYN